MSVSNFSFRGIFYYFCSQGYGNAQHPPAAYDRQEVRRVYNAFLDHPAVNLNVRIYGENLRQTLLMLALKTQNVELAKEM